MVKHWGLPRRSLDSRHFIKPFCMGYNLLGKWPIELMQNFEILMKSVSSVTILAILNPYHGIVRANKLPPHKGVWVDLGSTGIVFGTIAETVKKNSDQKGPLPIIFEESTDEERSRNSTRKKVHSSFP